MLMGIKQTGRKKEKKKEAMHSNICTYTKRQFDAKKK